MRNINNAEKLYELVASINKQVKRLWVEVEKRRTAVQCPLLAQDYYGFSKKKPKELRLGQSFLWFLR